MKGEKGREGRGNERDRRDRRNGREGERMEQDLPRQPEGSLEGINYDVSKVSLLGCNHCVMAACLQLDLTTSLCKSIYGSFSILVV